MGKLEGWGGNNGGTEEEINEGERREGETE